MTVLTLDSQYSAGLLASWLEAECVGDPSVRVHCIGNLDDEAEGLLVFAERRLKHPVACALVSAPMAEAKCSIIVANPKHAMRRLLERFPLESRESAHRRGIHPTAVVASDVVLGAEVCIGPYAVVESGVVLGDRVVLDAHVHIMHHVSLGEDTHIASGSVLYPHITLGARVRIGARCVLGDAGFGYDWDGSGWALFPQVGHVSLGDDVHVGPLSVIDRGALSDTVLEQGVKLDAFSMIGHGVVLGSHALFAACLAVGGSTQVGPMTVGGGRISISDHIRIPAGTRLAGGSNVASSLKHPGEYASGIPLMPARQWRRWLRFVFRAIGGLD